MTISYFVLAAILFHFYCYFSLRRVLKRNGFHVGFYLSSTRELKDFEDLLENTPSNESYSYLLRLKWLYIISFFLLAITIGAMAYTNINSMVLENY